VTEGGRKTSQLTWRFEVVDLNDPKQYWDLTKIPGVDSNSYKDWEGMCDPAEVVAVVDRIMVKWDDFTEDAEQLAWCKDMLLHYVHEVVDAAGEEALPNDDVLMGMYEAFQTLVRSPRYMMRSDAE
jgi:hypothetical protein